MIDQSGSMQGEKWTQAQQAARYVLENLNEEDRFNVIVFSTGYRMYAEALQPASSALDAAGWIDSLFAEGGTDINAGLLAALDQVSERNAAILFMTDGVPTEGVTEIEDIIANAQAAAKPNARIFSFGVGDDVNTLLLDTVVRDFKGTVPTSVHHSASTRQWPACITRSARSPQQRRARLRRRSHRASLP